MRILFVYDAVYPYETGGAEKRIWDLAHMLSRMGHDVAVAGPQYWGGPPTMVKDDVTYIGICRPINLLRNNRSFVQPLHFGMAAALFLGRSEGSYDIIDIGNTPFTSTLVGNIIGVSDHKVVSTWHEFWGPYWKSYSRMGWGLGIVFETLAARTSRHIICSSPLVRKKLISWGVREQRLKYVPNGVDFGAASLFRNSEKTSDLVYIGRLLRHKRVDLLVRAVAILKAEFPDISCNIVGSGEESPKLFRLAVELGLSSNIKFVGRLENSNEVHRAFSESKLFVLPSEREGFPNTMLEAFANGIPIVTTNSPLNGTASLVVPSKAGLVVPPTPDNLAKAIQLLLTDSMLRSRMGGYAEDFARKHDWSVVSDKLLKAYSEILNCDS